MHVLLHNTQIFTMQSLVVSDVSLTKRFRSDTLVI